MKDDCTWLNFRWGLDISYTGLAEVPILAQLCRKHGRFWDGEFFYMIQAEKVVLRWPDWRRNYRIDLDKVATRATRKNIAKFHVNRKKGTLELELPTHLLLNERERERKRNVESEAV